MFLSEISKSFHYLMKNFHGKLNKTQYHNPFTTIFFLLDPVGLYDAISILDIILKILCSYCKLDISINLFTAFRDSLLNVVPS